MAGTKAGEKDSVIAGIGAIEKIECILVVFDPLFIMGSMGVSCWGKAVRVFHAATKRKLSVITFSASGGARMQKGVISLAQMAKTSVTVYKHAKKNYYLPLLYVIPHCFMQTYRYLLQNKLGDSDNLLRTSVFFDNIP